VQGIARGRNTARKVEEFESRSAALAVGKGGVGEGGGRLHRGVRGGREGWHEGARGGGGVECLPDVVRDSGVDAAVLAKDLREAGQLCLFGGEDVDTVGSEREHRANTWAEGSHGRAGETGRTQTQGGKMQKNNGRRGVFCYNAGGDTRRPLECRK